MPTNLDLNLGDLVITKDCYPFMVIEIIPRAKKVVILCNGKIFLEELNIIEAITRLGEVFGAAK